jgi:uncharacterized protein (TIGR02996 family)
LALSVENLYAAVYADPASDEARQVLADRLVELGDKRGEVIALQMKDPKSPRAKKLIKQHRAAWLGQPLAEVWNDYHEAWRRGFPADIWCEPTEATVGDVRWNTVETLEMYGGGGAQEIFSRPVWRALRVVRGLRDAGLTALLGLRQRPPLESLQIYGAPEELTGLAGAFPGLRRLDINLPRWPAEPFHVAWLWESELVRQLASLDLRVNGEFALYPFAAAAEPFANLQRLCVKSAYFEFELTRDAAGRLSRLHVHNNGTVNAASYLAWVARALAPLPAGALTAFRYSKSGAQHPAAKLGGMKRAIARQTSLKEQKWR